MLADGLRQILDDLHLPSGSGSMSAATVIEKIRFVEAQSEAPLRDRQHPFRTTGYDPPVGDLVGPMTLELSRKQVIRNFGLDPLWTQLGGGSEGRATDDQG